MPTLRVLIGVQDQGMNGIESYAEQVALAARAVGHETTLLVTTAEVAAAVRERTAGSGATVVDAGLPTVSPRRLVAERLAPPLQTARVGRALRRVVGDGLRGFDVVHLNRPSLVPYVGGAAPRVCCAGWFSPHGALPRVAETWRHTRGARARRVMLTAKSLPFFLADERGYRAASAVVVGTETLAAQLRGRGVHAVACPPPVRVAAADGDEERRPPALGLDLLVCSGDLSHPRKNLRDAVRAAGLLARPDRPVVLRAVGRNPAALERAARALPPAARLELLGPRRPAEVQREMRRAHALLLPSLYEEWGYVAVESILSGAPVVTYPVYPFADMLAGGLGVVAEGTDAAALAAAAERAVAGPGGRALAAAGARRFGSAVVGARLTRVWADC